jgi:thymidylate synthase (FAD)
MSAAPTTHPSPRVAPTTPMTNPPGQTPTATANPTPAPLIARIPADSPVVDVMAGSSRHEIRLHQHGFIALIDAMPRLVPQGQTADAAIVQAARVSYGHGTKKVNEDRGLIRYLLRHRHTTPFEMVEFKFHIAMPIFVARQWVRHRTANVNEYSGRYSILPDRFYTPTLDNVRKQSKGNRQGGEEKFIATPDPKPQAFASPPAPPPPSAPQHSALGTQHSSQHSEDAQQASELVTAQEFLGYLRAVEGLYPRYLGLTEKGVSRELARLGLPVSLYTEFYWKCDLHNILRFLSLRMDPHAQLEIREYAEAMYALLHPIVPITMEAWHDYEFQALHLTRLEIEAIRGLRAGGSGELKTDNKREQAEWADKRAKLGL